MLSGTQSSKIEDFFEPSIKATVLHGKTFDDKNGLDLGGHPKPAIEGHFKTGQR